ncbi:AraC family transcriptional regulator [Streptomyces kunmingensis]|uniref:AraC family transcriptional regulator n=1 Tax=Streptomyces kunmingensis TaxID=68225 RepID=A0ABU6CAV8_9ACTN|nr:AraC family transcriptional regulator [Streptomyces kunmingensis]MEB3961839.1 AraC family transcriptional regulator [Streptomyces kunmingensis]
MDPLEDVLALLGLRSHLSAGLRAGGRWAVRFRAPTGVKFNAVRRGTCLLQVEGADPVTLRAGDCYLLTKPLPFVLRSEPAAVPVDGEDAVPVDAEAVYATTERGLARTGDGDGDEVLLIGGSFALSERSPALLLNELPPVIHVPADSSHAETLQWALAQISEELLNGQMGSSLVAEQLATVMFVHILRLHLARDTSSAAGLLTGLRDPVVATALACLHERPERPWTVADLARSCVVSRSTLAARFKELVGQSPIDYLGRWRVELAGRRLRQDDGTIAAVARAVGYGSESAFSTAFKRATGVAPRDYRSRYRAAAGPVG